MRRAEIAVVLGVVALISPVLAMPLIGQSYEATERYPELQQSNQTHWLQVELGAHQSELTGEFVLDEDSGDSNVDLDGNLQLNDDIGGRARLQFQVAEGSRFRLGYYGMEFEETTRLNSSITVDGNTYSSSDRVKSRVQLDTYEVGFIQNLHSSDTVSVDGMLQFNVIDFEGEVNNQDTGQTASKSQTVPLPYPGLRIDVNSTEWLGFFGAARFAYGSYSNTDYSSTDLEGGLRLKLDSSYDIRVGYRRFDYDVESDDTELDLTTEGPYASFTLRF